MAKNVPINNANEPTEYQANSSQQNRCTCSCCSGHTFSTYRDLSQLTRHCTKGINGTKYSRMDQVEFVEGSL